MQPLQQLVFRCFANKASSPRLPVSREVFVEYVLFPGACNFCAYVGFASLLVSNRAVLVYWVADGGCGVSDIFQSLRGSVECSVLRFTRLTLASKSSM